MTSPFLSTREAAVYLRFVGRDGQVRKVDLDRVYEFCTRYQVRTWKRGGRSVLIRQDDLDAALTPRQIGAGAPTGPVGRAYRHFPSTPATAGPISPSGETRTDSEDAACGQGQEPTAVSGKAAARVFPVSSARAGHAKRRTA